MPPVFSSSFYPPRNCLQDVPYPEERFHQRSFPWGSFGVGRMPFPNRRQLFRPTEQNNNFHVIPNPEKHQHGFPWGPWGLSCQRMPFPNRRPFNQNNSADDFYVNLDIQQFRPEEITVKVTGDNKIIVEGKHEERSDEQGLVSRQFVRRIVVPEGFDINKVQTRLSSDGVLKITAPKIKAQKESEHRSIPIIETGQPSKTAENTETETTQVNEAEEV